MRSLSLQGAKITKPDQVFDIVEKFLNITNFDFSCCAEDVGQHSLLEAIARLAGSELQVTELQFGKPIFTSYSKPSLNNEVGYLKPQLWMPEAWATWAEPKAFCLLMYSP